MLQPLAVVLEGNLMNSDILRHLGVRVALSVHSSLPDFCLSSDNHGAVGLAFLLSEEPLEAGLPLSSIRSYAAFVNYWYF